MNLIKDFFDAFGGIWCLFITLAILAIVPTVLGIVVLRPISRMAGRLHAPTRFMLSDFFWLVIQLQLAMGYCVRFIGVEHLDYFLLIGGFFFLATIGMWAGAVSFMSRAGVTVPSRRAVFILFLLPVTLGMMMGASFTVLVAAILKFNFARFEFQQGLEIIIAKTNMGFEQIMVGLALLPAICYGLRRTSLWILTGINLDETVEPESADLSSQSVA
jgi:hypothetical protein